MAPNAQPMLYTLEIKRDVPSAGLLLDRGALLLIPPVFDHLARGSFEGALARERLSSAK